MYLHLVAHVRADGVDLNARSSARIWNLLRRWAPQAVACVVVPRGFEIVVGTLDGEGTRRGIRQVLTHLVRRFPRTTWHPPDETRVERRALADCVRSVALRPCRDGLCDDPLQWLWNTHRDVCGAVAEPWVSGARLARALGEPPGGFRLLHHYFVTDPSGWTSPFPERSRRFDVEPHALLRAAEAACRFVPNHTPEHKRARLFFGVGRRTRLSLDALRAILPAPRATAFRRAVTVGTAEVIATLLCLGDTRLLYPSAPRASRPMERQVG